MTDAEILTAISELAHRELEWEGPLRPEMRLVEDLALDSLRLLTLAVAVEDRFRVALDEEDETAIETVADLVATVRSKVDRGD
jgi:acyl carrier protein